MALAPPTQDFVAAIRDALVSANMLRDQIVVLDPNSESVTPYDPETDTGGEYEPIVLIGPRAAYIKAIGATVATEAGLLRGIMRYRVQFIPEDGDPFIPSSSIVRVLPGGDNEVLQYFPLAVLGTPTGSIVALNKLECQTTMAKAPVWTAP